MVLLGGAALWTDSYGAAAGGRAATFDGLEGTALLREESNAVLGLELLPVAADQFRQLHGSGALGLGHVALHESIEADGGVGL
jgi:hypothetical protein